MSNEFSGYLSNGCGLIAKERVRQENKLGWSTEHDDTHVNEELRDAAIAYAIVCDDRADNPPSCWPWEDKDFNYSPHKAANLVKAGALIAAEIDRLRRKFQWECNLIAEKELGFTVFDDMDAYDLAQCDWIGQEPGEFLREHFGEDYARIAAVQEEQRQADEHAQDPDENLGSANEGSASTQPPEGHGEEE